VRSAKPRPTRSNPGSIRSEPGTEAQADPPGSSIPHVLTLSVLPALALIGAYRMTWICDDAFVSLRYARNLAHGAGLVYNAGERVEGYTNFLWTLLLGLAAALGARAPDALDVPVAAAMALGLFFFGLLVLLLAELSRRLFGTAGRLHLPLAACCLVLNQQARSWATSGLETSLLALLVLAGYGLFVVRKSAAGSLGAGTALAAAALTRPDAALFPAAVLLHWALLTRRRTERRVWLQDGAALLAPLLVLGLPHLLWRLWYYGRLLPNTFYAKSADQPYWSQGLVYVGLFLFAFHLVYLVPFVVWRVLRPGQAEPRREAVVLGGLIVLVHVLYVTRVGGDFMFGRFLVPVLPLVYVLVEALLRSVPARRARGLLLAAALVATALPVPIFAPQHQIRGIVEERDFYSLRDRWPRNKGRILHHFLADLPVKVEIGGAQCQVAYYSELPFVVDGYGLTNATIAHLPVERRGRPGHEKVASVELLRRLGVDFSVAREPDEYSGLALGPVRLAVLRYERPVMEALQGRSGVRFVDFPAYLDRAAASLEGRDPGQVARDLEGFRSYYFAWNADPQRLEAIEGWLRERASR
jgi:hypothetical protein